MLGLTGYSWRDGESRSVPCHCTDKPHQSLPAALQSGRPASPHHAARGYLHKEAAQSQLEGVGVGHPERVGGRSIQEFEFTMCLNSSFCHQARSHSCYNLQEVQDQVSTAVQGMKDSTAVFCTLPEYLTQTKTICTACTATSWRAGCTSGARRIHGATKFWRRQTRPEFI